MKPDSNGSSGTSMTFPSVMRFLSSTFSTFDSSIRIGTFPFQFQEFVSWDCNFHSHLEVLKVNRSKQIVYLQTKALWQVFSCFVQLDKSGQKVIRTKALNKLFDFVPTYVC
jgi:hypothetical protein